MKLRFALVVLLGICNVSIAASRAELENCQWDNGNPIPPKTCNVLRREYNEKIAKKKAEAAQLHEAQQRDNEMQARRRAAQEDQQRRNAESNAKFEQEQAERRAMAEQAQREQEQYERDVKKRAETRKAQCGDDYGTPKIGMTLERAKQCVGGFKLTSQLNRADGVVSTYQAGRIHAHVIDGRIVAWSRY